MLPVSVPLNVPPPEALLKVIVVALVGFAGLPLASCYCTVTLKAAPSVPVIGTTVKAKCVAGPANTMFPLVTGVNVTPPDAVAVNVIVPTAE